MYKTLKVTGNKAHDQHTGRDIPVRVPGEYFPSHAREGSCWALGLQLCLAMVGDDPSVPLHCVRGDTQAPDKALRMHSVSSAWPCSPRPGLTLLKCLPEKLRSPPSPPGHQLFWGQAENILVPIGREDPQETQAGLQATRARQGCAGPQPPGTLQFRHSTFPFKWLLAGWATRGVPSEGDLKEKDAPGGEGRHAGAARDLSPSSWEINLEPGGTCETHASKGQGRSSRADRG